MKNSGIFLKQTQFLGLVLGLALGMLFHSQKAFAWGDRGHEIIGDVAEAMVEAQTLDFVRGILGVEPFSVAAVFPDKVRDDDVRFTHRGLDGNGTYDFSGFHICDVPHGGKIQDEEGLNSKNAYSAIINAGKILRDTSSKYPREAKMIALRYLIHVMGDIHQPLHIGNGLDLGGNTCLIKDGSRMNSKDGSANLPSLNFHSFWDDAMVQHFGMAMAGNEGKAPRYLSDYRKLLKSQFGKWFTSEQKAKVSSGSLSDWMNESLSLRDSGVYPGDVSPVTLERAKSRPYCRYKNADGSMGNVDSAQIPVLDRSYIDRLVAGPEAPVALQLLKGGLRLAKILDAIAADVLAQKSDVPLLKNSDQTNILEMVLKGMMNSKDKSSSN